MNAPNDDRRSVPERSASPSEDAATLGGEDTNRSCPSPATTPAGSDRPTDEIPPGATRLDVLGPPSTSLREDATLVGWPAPPPDALQGAVHEAATIPPVNRPPGGLPSHGRESANESGGGPDDTSGEYAVSDPPAGLVASTPPSTASLDPQHGSAQKTGREQAAARSSLGSPSQHTSRFRGSRATVPEEQPVLRTFGDYELLSEIARGGMGVVFRARQVALNRIVALKMILQGNLASDADVSRFYAEAEAAGNLQHPGIVAIYEIGNCEGRDFFSMEFIEGQSLSHAIKEGPLAPRVAAEYVRQVAEAVEHAHQHGILHRDLKPSNIILDAGGRTKVTDFGLARPIDGGSQLTASGAILGTPSYMPPEQASGTTVTAASDIYSLGATLYDLACGRPPFAGATVVDTLLLVLDAEPAPPSALNRRVDRDLDTICLKCLHKEPNRRYPTAQAVADDLARYLAGQPISARPVGRAERTWLWCRRNRLVASLSALAVVALVVGSVVSTYFGFEARAQAGVARSEKDRADSRAAAEAAANQRAQERERESRNRLVRQYVATGSRLVDEGDTLASLPWFAEALRLDHDGQEPEAMHRYRLAAVLEQCPRCTQVLFHSAPVRSAEFSADGTRLVTACTDGKARVWDAASGEVGSGKLLVEVAHGGAVVWAQFSPQGDVILTASADNTARLWRATDGTLQGAPLVHEGAVNFATFSADGSRVVTASDDKTARVWSTDTGEPVAPPLAHDHPVRYAAFSPDGQRIVTAAGTPQRARFGAGSAHVWDATSGAALSALPHDGNVVFASFSPDGQRIVTASDDWGARLWDVANGRLVVPPLRHEDMVTHAAFSADGAYLITTSDDDTARLWNARTGEIAASPLRHNGEVRWASFSPDGRLVATAGLYGVAQVFRANNGERFSPVLRHTGQVDRVAFSPDGRRLATACRDGAVRVWDLAMGQPAPLRMSHGSLVDDGALSPDGTRGATGGFDGLAVLWDTTTGKPLTAPLSHAAKVHTVRFSPDGQWLLTSSEDGLARLFQTSDGSAGHTFRHAAGVRYADWSPDGTQVATASADKTAQIWDAKTGETSGEPLAHESTLTFVGFSPDGQRIATGTEGGEAFVWTAAGKRLAGPLKHSRRVFTAFFSPDSARLVTASGDALGEGGGEVFVWNAETGAALTGNLMREHGAAYAIFDATGKQVLTAGLDNVARIWDAATALPLTPPMRHTWDLYRATFSADGLRIATCAGDRSARVWDAATGEAITPPLMHPAFCFRAIFGPRGDRLFTVSYEGTASVWELPYDDRPVAELRALAELLSGQRLHETSGIVPLEFAEFKTAWEELRPRHTKDFTCRPAQIVAWHQRHVWDARMIADFFPLAWHLGWLHTLEPKQLNHRYERGRASAELGNWEQAADDYAAIAPAASDDANLQYEYALLCLAAGRPEAYRQVCQQLLDRAVSSGDGNLVNTAVWTSVLSPASVLDVDLAFQLAEKILQSDPENAGVLNTVGAACCRAARAEQAVVHLRRAIELGGGEGSPHDWLFLALALVQLDELEEARRWIDKADAWFIRESDPATKAAAATRLPWSTRSELELLLREAKQALHDKAAGEAAGTSAIP